MFFRAQACFKTEGSSLLPIRRISPKGRVKRTKPCAKRIRPKRQVGNGLLLVGSRIRSTFVGYPLHSYQQVTCLKNIRQCWLHCATTKLRTLQLEEAIKTAHSKISSLFWLLLGAIAQAIIFSIDEET